MYAVDQDFKMSYDLRNDQEASARMKRHDTATTGKVTDDQTSRTNDCYGFGSSGMRWACMTGLALLGVSVGFRLGRDQYDRHKSVTSQ